jgi:peptidyl-prolyl cis-trans isomerase A (cyclophilin A)
MATPTTSIRFLGPAIFALTACQSGPVPEPEPGSDRKTDNVWREPKTKVIQKSLGGEAPAGKASAAPTPKAPEIPGVSPGDPHKGTFTLDEATAGLPPGKTLVAELHTTVGKLECELWPEKAPNTVANFVGLARGVRAWRENTRWAKRPLYDGTPFHRVVKGFMIQGGDPLGSGAGGPGYVFPDELWEGAKHDQPGLLCMANRGKDTNGSQFFITDGAAPHLDGGYTIFGKCAPTELVTKIASVPARGDRAIDPVKLERVVIRR